MEPQTKKRKLHAPSIYGALFCIQRCIQGSEFEDLSLPWSLPVLLQFDQLRTRHLRLVGTPGVSVQKIPSHLINAHIQHLVLEDCKTRRQLHLGRCQQLHQLYLLRSSVYLQPPTAHLHRLVAEDVDHSVAQYVLAWPSSRISGLHELRLERVPCHPGVIRQLASHPRLKQLHLRLLRSSSIREMEECQDLLAQTRLCHLEELELPDGLSVLPFMSDDDDQAVPHQLHSLMISGRTALSLGRNQAPIHIHQLTVRDGLTRVFYDLDQQLLLRVSHLCLPGPITQLTRPPVLPAGLQSVVLAPPPDWKLPPVAAAAATIAAAVRWEFPWFATPAAIARICTPEDQVWASKVIWTPGQPWQVLKKWHIAELFLLLHDREALVTLQQHDQLLYLPKLTVISSPTFLLHEHHEEVVFLATQFPNTSDVFFWPDPETVASSAAAMSALAHAIPASAVIQAQPVPITFLNNTDVCNFKAATYPHSKLMIDKSHRLKTLDLRPCKALQSLTLQRCKTRFRLPVTLTQLSIEESEMPALQTSEETLHDLNLTRLQDLKLTCLELWPSFWRDLRRFSTTLQRLYLDVEPVFIKSLWGLGRVDLRELRYLRLPAGAILCGLGPELETLQTAAEHKVALMPGHNKRVRVKHLICEKVEKGARLSKCLPDMTVEMITCQSWNTSRFSLLCGMPPELRRITLQRPVHSSSSTTYTADCYLIHESKRLDKRQIEWRLEGRHWLEDIWRLCNIHELQARQVQAEHVVVSGSALEQQQLALLPLLSPSCLEFLVEGPVQLQQVYSMTSIPVPGVTRLIIQGQEQEQLDETQLRRAFPDVTQIQGERPFSTLIP